LPHALGLALPLVITITTAMGARNCILVRNRQAKTLISSTKPFWLTGIMEIHMERGEPFLRVENVASLM
jgi:hypothetical protein